jgi:hypothetical protein
MDAGQNHFESHHALELNLQGLVNHAHAAAAQLAKDLVAGDGWTSRCMLG